MILPSSEVGKRGIIPILQIKKIHSSLINISGPTMKQALYLEDSHQFASRNNEEVRKSLLISFQSTA